MKPSPKVWQAFSSKEKKLYYKLYKLVVSSYFVKEQGRKIKINIAANMACSLIWFLEDEYAPTLVDNKS